MHAEAPRHGIAPPMMFANSHQWTVAEVRAMQDEERIWPRFELIDGELIVTPAQIGVHERAVAELRDLLEPYVRAQHVGMVEVSPADIELEAGSLVQPDVFVTPLVDGHAPIKWPETQLLLAAEVTCAPSAHVDRVTKRRFYTRVGVAEYWVVDLEAYVIERNVGAETRPEIHDDTLSWHPAKADGPLVIDIRSYFERIYRRDDVA